MMMKAARLKWAGLVQKRREEKWEKEKEERKEEEKVRLAPRKSPIRLDTRL